MYLHFFNFLFGLDMVTSSGCKSKHKETEVLMELKGSREKSQDERVSLLYSAWSAVLSKSPNEYLQKHGISESNLPKAPHLENCKVKSELNERLDKRIGNESYPAWTSWKGLLDTFPASANSELIKKFRHQAESDGAYPPWVCFAI